MPFTDEDLDRAERRKHKDKPRTKGTLPHLPDDHDPEQLRDWLTIAFRPGAGWHVHSFERAGRQKTDPCSITLRNGRDERVYRFGQQSDLWMRLRTVVISAGGRELRMPHLTGGEIEDVWVALCALGEVLTEFDDRDETTGWMHQLLDVAHPFRGYTLVPDDRHNGLMAIRELGRFARSDALALLRGPHAQEHVRRPVRIVDEQTGEQWVRSGEATTFIRYVVGVEPLSYATLRARLREIGVSARPYEDRRPPHPKLTLFALSGDLVEYAESVK